MSSAHFLPRGGYVGDVIPFEHDGMVWLYYLLDTRDTRRPVDRQEGMPWAAVTTTDFARFTDRGVVLPSGGAEAEDFDCYTGSVVTDDDGINHLFYTGHNPRIRTGNGDLQVICHATSSEELDSWTRHPEWTFGALEGYSPEDWRDPFVFRAAPGEPWQMLLATRRIGASYRRSGVVARLVSDDLVHWRDAEPFWNPHRFITQECPDVFPWGEHWYLVYSEFSDSFQTRYRIADSPDGPWRAPEHDTVDGRAFYASKTVEHDGERHFIGWIATKEGGTDSGSWQWAGTMSALRAEQSPDGSLRFGLPRAVTGVYDDVHDLRPGLAPVEGADPVVGSGARDRHSTWLAGEIPTEALIVAEFDIAPGTHACGLLLRSSEDAEQAYSVRLEPYRERLVFDRWPRGSTGREQWQVRGDVPHEIESERPVPLPAGRHTVEVHLDGDICVIVVDDRVALSTRVYDLSSGRVGVFATDGAFELVRLEARVRS